MVAHPVTQRYLSYHRQDVGSNPAPSPHFTIMISLKMKNVLF